MSVLVILSVLKNVQGFLNIGQSLKPNHSSTKFDEVNNLLRGEHLNIIGVRET